MKRSRVNFLGLSLPWIATFALFWIFPLAYSAYISFTDYRLLVNKVSWVGWSNYATLFSNDAFIQALVNTFIFVIGTIPVTTVLALLLALMVNGRFPGRAIFRSAYFLPSITSMVVIALIFTNLYERGGYLHVLAEMVGVSVSEHGLLYDSGTALYAIMAMDVWMSVGYYMLIFLAGLKSIPDELYEAAEINGAGRISTFFHVTLPLLRPVALFIIVINSIKSFQVFVEIFVMTKGKFETATAVYYLYEQGLTSGFQVGKASAAAWVLFIIIAVFSVLQFTMLRRRGGLQ